MEEAGEIRQELERAILGELRRADLTVGEAHAVLVRTVTRSMEIILREAAATHSLPEVRTWLTGQLEALRMFVAGWQPGAPPELEPAAETSGSDAKVVH